MLVELLDSNGLPLLDANGKPLMCERCTDDDEQPPRREDYGPTIEEYVAAGYLPENYPPEGYAAKPSPALDHYRATGSMPADKQPDEIIVPGVPSKPASRRHVRTE